MSLGSSKRDKKSQVRILNEDFEVSRIGTDGDMKRYAELMHELDGNVDAIGLGGLDRYFWVDDVRYTISDADKLARVAVKTPVVDGSGVKNTVERKTVEYMQEHNLVDFHQSNVFVVSAVDRFGMAQSIAELAKAVIFGDLMFGIGVPIPLHSYGQLRILAKLLLPIVTRLPFKWIYPTGASQDVIIPRYGHLYKWADIIAGDYLIIKRSMPTVESGFLAGKTILTNTVTEEDTVLFRERGVKLLVTGTPKYDGRYYATNVFEAMMVAILGKRPEDITKSDYEELMVRLKWEPTVTWLNN